MAEAFQESRWAMTSEILAAIYNTIRDPKKRRAPFKGSDFNPTIKKAGPLEYISVEEWRKRSGGKLRT